MTRLPTDDDVRAAARRIHRHAHRTPVLTSRQVNDQIGAEVLFKCENFQRAGAFKFRGAFNTLSQLSADRRRAGVVAYSSGNHSQAVALSARILGIAATIVMPSDAPASKVAATKGYGGYVLGYDRDTEEPEPIARGLAEERGLTLVPPYDHPHIVAGQGTAALELFEDAGRLDALFVPLGGGGLLAGTALATRAMSPATMLYGVEPAAGDDGQRSFRSGSVVHIDTPRTIADGARTRHLGDLTFEIIRRDVDDVLTATDDDLVDCLRIFASTLKIVVEPTGCLGLAGVRNEAARLRGRRVGVLVSGGNVDLARYCELLVGDGATG